MYLRLFNPSDTEKVVALFTSVFTQSEGEAEGKSIANLVSNLIAKTQPCDLIGYVAVEGETIVGCIFFSRFKVPGDQTAFILSPVAIDSSHQGCGIGQQLINFGLGDLKAQQVKLVVTYGDPAFYSKTGFHKISESVVKAPFPLSQPEGWLAQSLDGQPVGTLNGETWCVEALSDPGYW